MKKFLKIFVVLIVLLSLSSVFAGCISKSDPKRIDNFLKKLEKADSGEIIFEIKSSGISLNMVMKVDGNKSYSSNFLAEGEFYTEEADGMDYIYYKENGNWKKTPGTPTASDDESVLSFAEEFEELFNSENYTWSKEDNAFNYNTDETVSFLDISFSSIQLSIKNNNATITGKAIMGSFYPSTSLDVDIILTIKNLDATTIELPEATTGFAILS